MEKEASTTDAKRSHPQKDVDKKLKNEHLDPKSRIQDSKSGDG